MFGDDKYISPYLLLPLRSLAECEREWAKRRQKQTNLARLRLVEPEQKQPASGGESGQADDRQISRP